MSPVSHRKWQTLSTLETSSIRDQTCVWLGCGRHFLREDHVCRRSAVAPILQQRKTLQNDGLADQPLFQFRDILQCRARALSRPLSSL